MMTHPHISHLIRSRTTLVAMLLILSSVSTFAQWEAPMRLSKLQSGALLNENMGPCLVSSGDTLHALWSQQRDKGTVIYTVHSLDTGTTWSTEIALSDSLATSTFPVIAARGTHVYAVWMQLVKNIRASMFCTSSDGGEHWSRPFCLDSNTAFWPGVAVSGSRVYVTLNKRVDSTNTEVYIMHSDDQGQAWSPEFSVSNAKGRSEDQSIAVQADDIYMSWNDNRDGIMKIYYRHSSDAGLSWGPETALTSTASYTSMVSVNGPYVDVPFGLNQGHFNVWLRQSSDFGQSFGPQQQRTQDTALRLYPFLVRDSQQLHLGFVQALNGMHALYQHSSDGGQHWDSTIVMGNGAQPFIALIGCSVHCIWPDSGKITYRRNMNGNCPTVVADVNTSDIDGVTNSSFRLVPNPCANVHDLRLHIDRQSLPLHLQIFSSLGEMVSDNTMNSTELPNSILSALHSGSYFVVATSMQTHIHAFQCLVVE